MMNNLKTRAQLDRKARVDVKRMLQRAKKTKSMFWFFWGKT